MILDSLDHRGCYAEMTELKSILDVMAEIQPDTMPQSKMIIDGDKAFINPVLLTTKPFAETKFEAHQRYADVHCIIAGIEEIIVNDLSKVTEIEAYSKENDIGFYQGESGTVCILKPGDFLVCFPQDAHRVAIAPSIPDAVIKLVGKIKMD
ncbi:MAG: YhcH/YjgK/YiaL family protein [Solobacterium sp.]|jgi:YhcH/YjgK/YiaL family protein|nr:YhcH/YjgK/YiaL family protein [Solobacterium sp.]MCH4206004.1 YhcH/YjgK/YiaL family protein [Solobacterium sp.]MCH4227388.1 YhcH/YjgK/YiaL family protein [Solobacterium sp.]MCH4282757.1 YhcH/YjgK/YiaL family protein [Solobacterium sp.]